VIFIIEYLCESIFKTALAHESLHPGVLFDQKKKIWWTLSIKKGKFHIQLLNRIKNNCVKTQPYKKWTGYKENPIKTTINDFIQSNHIKSDHIWLEYAINFALNIIMLNWKSPKEVNTVYRFWKTRQKLYLHLNKSCYFNQNTVILCLKPAEGIIWKLTNFKYTVYTVVIGFPSKVTIKDINSLKNFTVNFLKCYPNSKQGKVQLLIHLLYIQSWLICCSRFMPWRFVLVVLPINALRYFSVQ
jgi:hypothetical protein